MHSFLSRNEESADLGGAPRARAPALRVAQAGAYSTLDDVVVAVEN